MLRINADNRNHAGFSIIELMVAMTVTLVVMSIAVTLLARSLNIRSRENERADEVADVQRALNIMSREISNAGFNLSNNGIVAADSNSQSVRVRMNLNKFDTSVSAAARSGINQPGIANGEDAGEDVTYFVNAAENTNYLARWDPLQPTGVSLPEMRKTVLANRVDAVRFYYFDTKVTYTQDAINCNITSPLNAAGATQAQVTPDKAKFVVIAACVTAPEVGQRGSPGYQPAYPVLLMSNVALRNSRLTKY